MRLRLLTVLLTVLAAMFLAGAGPVQARPMATTTYGQADTAVIIASLYPYGRHPDARCYKLWTSTLDKRWVLVDFSAYGLANATRCNVSDGWQYARKVGNQWYFLKYQGSSFDSCATRLAQLQREGMPTAVAKDIERGFASCWR